MIDKAVLQEIVDFLPVGRKPLGIRAARVELSCFDAGAMAELAWGFVSQGFQVNVYSPRHFTATSKGSGTVEIDVQVDTS